MPVRQEPKALEICTLPDVVDATLWTGVVKHCTSHTPLHITFDLPSERHAFEACAEWLTMMSGARIRLHTTMMSHN